MDLYKGFSEWMVCVGKDNNTVLFFWAGSSTVTERCDWWLSSRSNIDLSFLAVIRFMKSSMNNRRSSSVFHPDLLRRGYGNITVFKVLAINLTQRIDLHEIHEFSADEWRGEGQGDLICDSSVAQTYLWLWSANRNRILVISIVHAVFLYWRGSTLIKYHLIFPLTPIAVT